MPKIMPYQLQVQILKKMIGEGNDVVDVEGEIDKSLSLSENINAFKSKGFIKEKLEETHQKDYAQSITINHLEERLQEELECLKLTDIASDTFYENLNNSIDLLMSNKSFSLLMVAGRGGTGKTTKGREILARKEINFAYRSGHITPLELFRILHENYNKQVVIFDDSQPILENKSSISLLLQACDTRDVREVMWNTSKDLDISKRFEFEGKIIIITNQEFEEIYEPLSTRSIKCEVDFDNLTMMKIINSLCKLEETEKEMIMNLLNENFYKMEMNLRLYKLLEMILIHLKSLNRLDDFNKLAQMFLELETNPKLKYVYDCLKQTTDIRKQMSMFLDKFGCNKRTWYNYKERVVNMIGELNERV